MEFEKYIIDQALILIPVLYVLGSLIKSSAVNDKYIPILLLIVSLVLCFLMLGISVQSVIQAVLVTGVTVYGNQLVKQMAK